MHKGCNCGVPPAGTFSTNVKNFFSNGFQRHPTPVDENLENLDTFFKRFDEEKLQNFSKIVQKSPHIWQKNIFYRTKQEKF
jgi:hypothetical protein